MTPTEEKKRLRQALMRVRDDLDPKVRSAASVRMLEHLRAWSVFTAARGVAAFMSIRTEPDTNALCRAVLAGGRPLFLPRVASRTRLAFHRLEGTGALEQLVAGGFGLHEPATSAPQIARLSRREGVDLVIVPGLGFGRDGARLGYGAGYYDRALGEAEPEDRPVTVALVFARLINPPEGLPPVEDHDVRVDHLLSEDGLQPALA